MTEFESAKITIEIDRLQKEAGKLEKKAANDDSMYASALATYGSELAGPPQSIIMDRNTAGELRKRAEFFGSAKRGEVGLNDITILETRVSEINKEIAELQTEKGIAYLRIRLLQQLAEVIKN